MRISADIREAGVRLGTADPLTRLAAKYKSDKGVTIFPFHGYTGHYARLFEPFRFKPINILEIGLARRPDRRTLGITCPSLSMWLEYFPSASVWGFDIDDFSSVAMPRTRIFRGDQGNVDDLGRLVAACPQFDIVIDDGSHASYHQQVTLRTLFPHTSPGGIFVIEDLHWQPGELESVLPPVKEKTVDLLRNRTALQELIGGVRDVLFFDSPLEHASDTVGVILKA
jgi:hypothetical protein